LRPSGRSGCLQARCDEITTLVLFPVIWPAIDPAIQASKAATCQPPPHQYRPPVARRLNTCRSSASYCPRVEPDPDEPSAEAAAKDLEHD
jgi:hypothetical protein